MNEFLELISKFASNLNRRSLAAIAIAVAFAILVTVAHEIFTSRLALDKYASAASLLRDLDFLTRSENEAVSSSANQILREVESIVKGAAEEHQRLSPTQHRIALAFVMGFPWVALSLVGVVEAFRHEPDWEYAVFGCLFLGLLIGSTAYFIPPSMHWFYRYIFIPVLTYSVMLSVFYAVADDDNKDGTDSAVPSDA